MNKILAVVRREFIARVHTKAFVISTVLLPLMMIGITVVTVMLMMSGGDKTLRIAVVDASPQALGTHISKTLGAEHFGSGDNAQARYAFTLFPVTGDTTAERDRRIAQTRATGKSDAPDFNGVLVIHADTADTGRFGYYGDNVSSQTAMARLQTSLTQVLTSERLSKQGLDPKVVAQAMRSANLQTVKVSDGKITGQSGATSFMIAYFMGIILYMAVLIYGTQTMTSVIEEKTSRIMEVLASSLTPFQMLLGKVLGVGAAGLTQMAIWGGSAYLLTSQAGRLAKMFGVSPDAVAAASIPIMSGDLLAVFLLFFALGFLLYGALYAAIGSMCNTVQETQQYSTIVTMFVLIGFLAVFALINDPTGRLGVVLSLVPLFSPFTMPVRWSLTAVPWSQLVLSIALMIGLLLACVWLAARIYRTGILMYGKKPSIKELWRWLRAG